MNAPGKELCCELLVIGTGMAGMAAALFAARQGIDTVQVGLTGELAFASGLIDLLGVHPLDHGAVVEDPFQGIARLCREEPRHPYAHLDPETIREAVRILLDFLAASNYPHTAHQAANQMVITPVGTLKPTYAVPHTMTAGVTALAQRAACLLVDFAGLKGYSAVQIAQSLKGHWPDLRPIRIDFPDSQGELYTEHMARALDSLPTREKLIAAIRPQLGDARYVGLPAVLGFYRTGRVLEDLRQGLGVPVFEIPTMLPAVPGVRLRELFEQRLPAMGVRPLWQQRVLAVQRLNDGRWSAAVGYTQPEHRVVARSVILCSGRFFGKGLHARRDGICETIFNLPVVQPAKRASWHQKDLFDPKGHPINRAGISVDDNFRPVDLKSGTVYQNLFAAGSILACQDWMRQKCGSGLAVATAYGAVTACSAFLASV